MAANDILGLEREVRDEDNRCTILSVDSTELRFHDLTGVRIQR